VLTHLTEPEPRLRVKSVKGTAFLLVLLALSLGLNVVLGWQVRSSKHRAAPTADSSTLQESSLLAPFAVKNLEGVEQVISYSDTTKPTVLYVFSLACVWSVRNVDRVRTLAKSAASSHRFVALSLRDDDIALLDMERQKLGFPVFNGLSRDTIESLGLGSTPQTIVVSPKGRVVKNWVGSYGRELKKEIEAYFGVQLLEMPANEQAGSQAESQSCTRCVLEGLFYSKGAVVTNGDRKLRCGTDGRWVQF